MDRKFVLTALGYALIGLLLGIYMAASKNHGQLVTHAHIMLLGFVVSFVYALCHKLWLTTSTNGTIATLQYYLHQVGTLLLLISLFLLYGKYADEKILDSILAISSIIVLLGVIFMKVLIIKSFRTT